MMTRDIVQISGQGNILFALCDDGSLWRLAPSKIGPIGADGNTLEWVRMQRVPQEPKARPEPPRPPDAAPGERAIKVR